MHINHNPDKKCFETVIEDYTAIIEYTKEANKIYLTHTKVPKELGGRGVGSKLVENVLQRIEKENLKLIPLCPFVAAYVKKHPKWEKILHEEVNLKEE